MDSALISVKFFHKSDSTAEKSCCFQVEMVEQRYNTPSSKIFMSFWEFSPTTDTKVEEFHENSRRNEKLFKNVLRDFNVVLVDSS